MQHECDALLVTKPGGGVCAQCEFTSELEEPEEGTFLAFRVFGGKHLDGFCATVGRHPKIEKVTYSSFSKSVFILQTRISKRSKIDNWL